MKIRVGVEVSIHLNTGVILIRDELKSSLAKGKRLHVLRHVQNDMARIDRIRFPILQGSGSEALRHHETPQRVVCRPTIEQLDGEVICLDFVVILRCPFFLIRKEPVRRKMTKCNMANLMGEPKKHFRRCSLPRKNNSEVAITSNRNCEHLLTRHVGNVHDWNSHASTPSEQILKIHYAPCS